MHIPRVRCNLLSLTAHNAEIDIESWEDTKLYSAGCSWLSIPQENLDLQCGRFDTLEDRSITKPQKLTTRRITFERPYYALPKVVVWLEALSTPKHNCRIRVKAEHVDISGFTLHVEAWADTDILCATAAWFAHSADREDVCSGTFNTLDVRSWTQPRLQTSSYTPFGGRRFSKKPRVFSALNTLDVDKGRNLRIRLHTSDLTMNGMTWHLDGWSDTTVYSAGASYIAFDQD